MNSRKRGPAIHYNMDDHGRCGGWGKLATEQLLHDPISSRNLQESDLRNRKQDCGFL